MSDDHDPHPPAPSAGTANTNTKAAAGPKAKVGGNKKQQRQQQQQPLTAPPIQSATHFLPYLGPSPPAAAASDAIAAAATALANGSSQQLMSAMQHFIANSAAANANASGSAANPSSAASPLQATSGGGVRNPMTELMFQPQLNQLHTTADHVRAFHALAELIDKFSTLPPPTASADPLTSAIPGLFTKGTLAFIPLATVPLVDNGLSLAQSVIISDATKLRMDSGDLHVDRYMIQRSAIIMQLPPILAMRALSRTALQREGIALAPVIKDVCTVLQFMLRPLKYDRRKAPLVARLEMSHAKLLVTILMDFVHDMFVNTNAPPCTCASASAGATDKPPTPTPSSSTNASPAPSPNSKQKSSTAASSKPKSACLIPRPLLQSLLDYLAYCADPAYLPSLGDQAIQILALCDMYAWLHDEQLHMCTALEDMPADVLHRFVGALARCYEYPVAAARTIALVPPAAKAGKAGGKPAPAPAKDSKPAPAKSAAATAAAKEKSKPSSAASATSSTTAASPDAWLIRVPDHWQLATIINARRARTVHTMFTSAGSILDPDTTDHTPCRSGIRELKFSLGPRLDITVEENEDDDDEHNADGDEDDVPERANPLLLRDAAGYIVRAIAKHQVSAHFCAAVVNQMPAEPLSAENARQVEVALSLTWLVLSTMEKGTQHIPVEGNHPKGKETAVRVFVASVMNECQKAVASKDPLLCASAIRAAWTLLTSPIAARIHSPVAGYFQSTCTNAITDGLAIIFSTARRTRASPLVSHADLLARADALDFLAHMYRATLTSQPTVPLATWIVDSLRVFGAQVHASLADSTGNEGRHLLGKVIEVLESIPMAPYTLEDGSYGGAGIADRTAAAAFNAHVAKHVYREWEAVVGETSSARWAQVMWMVVLTMRLTWSKDGADRNPFYAQPAIHQFLNQAWRALEEPTKLCARDPDDEPVDDDDDWEDLDLAEYEAIVADERHIDEYDAGARTKRAGDARARTRAAVPDVAAAAAPEFAGSHGDGLEAGAAARGSGLMQELYAAMVTAEGARGQLGMRDYGDADEYDGDAAAAAAGSGAEDADGESDDEDRDDEHDEDDEEDDDDEDPGAPEFNIRYLLAVDCALMWVCYHHNFKAVDEEWAQVKNLLDVGAMDPHLLHTQATGKLLGYAFNLPCLHKGNKHHHPEARHGRCHGPRLLDHVLTRYFDEAWADAKTVISTCANTVPANKYPIMHTTLMAAIRHTAPLLRGFRSNVAYMGPAHWIKDEQEKRMAAIVKELSDVSATLSSQTTSGPLPWMTASPAPTDCTSHAHVQRDLLLAQFEAMLMLSPDWKWLAVMFRSALRHVPTAHNARANFISQALLGPTFMSPWVRGSPTQHVLLLTILRSLIFHLQSPASPALAANDIQAIVSTIADTIPDPIPYNVKQGGFAPRGDPLSAWNRERRDAPYEYRPAAPADRLLSPATVWVVRSLERLVGAYRARVAQAEFEALVDGVGEDRIGRLLDMGVDKTLFNVIADGE